MAYENPEFERFLERIDRVLREAELGPIDENRAIEGYVAPQRARADFADVLGPQRQEIDSALQKIVDDMLQQRLEVATRISAENRAFHPLDRELLASIDDLMNAVQDGDVVSASRAEKLLSEAVNDPRAYGMSLSEAADLERSAKQAVEFARQREGDMLEQLFPELGKTTREELVRQNPHLSKDLNMAKLMGQDMSGSVFAPNPQLAERARADMRLLAERISSLPPDQSIVVFHGTSLDTVEKATSKGLNLLDKPMGATRAAFESGGTADWLAFGDAPGKGLYVTLDPMLAQEAAMMGDMYGKGGGGVMAIRVKVGDIVFPPEAYMTDQNWLGYYNQAFGFPEGKFPAEAPRAAWLSDVGGMIKPTRYLSPDEVVDVSDLVGAVSLDYGPEPGIASLSNPKFTDDTAEWFRNNLLDRLDEKWGKVEMQKTVTPFPEIPATQRQLPAPAAAAEDVGVVIPKTTEAASKAGTLEKVAAFLRGEGKFGTVGKAVSKVGRGAALAGDMAFAAQAAAAAPHIGYTVDASARLAPNFQPGTFIPEFLKAAQKVSKLPYSGVGPTVDPKSPAFQGGGGGGLKFQ